MENQAITPTESKPRKNNTWFGKIGSKEDAIKVIKDSSNGFYFLAALQIIIGYFVLGLTTIIDGVIIAVLAFVLWKFRSIVAAVFLLLFSIVSIVVTAINQFGGGTGGSNTILAVLMIWISIRAVQATFKLHKLEKA
jgi:cobalamin synthase